MQVQLDWRGYYNQTTRVCPSFCLQLYSSCEAQGPQRGGDPDLDSPATDGGGGVGAAAAAAALPLKARDYCERTLSLEVAHMPRVHTRARARVHVTHVHYITGIRK